MALATLSVDLIARLASFEESFNKAARISEKNAALIEARWAKVGAATSTAFAALGISAGVGGLALLARNSINAIDALNDVADATGSTVENISALEDVALRTGTNLDTVQTALIKFNGVLKDAKPGSDAEKALKAIGLNAEELRKIDPAEALKKTADALAGFADDGNKARLTQELFGKSLKEVAPFLKDLAEQGKLNATVTTKQAEEAEKLNKEIFKFQAGATQFARSVASDILPSINNMIEKFGAAKEAFGGTFGALFRNSGNMGGDFSNAVEGLQHYRAELEKTAAKQLVLDESVNTENDGFGLAVDAAEKNRARIESIKQQIKFYELLTKTAKDAAGAGRGVVNPGSTGKPSAPDVATALPVIKTDEFDKLIAKINEKTAAQLAEIETEKALSDAQKLTLDTMVGLRDGTIKLTQAQAAKVATSLEELNKLDRTNTLRKETAKLVEEGMKIEAEAAKAQLAQADAIEKQVQAMRDATAEIGLEGRALTDLQAARLEDAAARKEQLAATMQEAGESEASVAAIRKQAAALRDQAAATREAGAAKQRQEVKTSALAIVGQSQQGQVDSLTKQYGELNTALERGDINTRQYADGLDVLDQRFADLTKPIEAAQEKLSTFADQAQRNIIDGLGGTFEKLFRGEFDSIDELWKDLLIKMAAQAASQQLAESLFGKDGKRGDGSLVGDLFKAWSSFGGSSVGQADGGAWAKGVQFYATGDVFSQATMFKHQGGLGVLGEAGPEAVMPLRRGADGKLGVAASGAGGGMTVHLSQQIMVGEFVTPSQVAQVAERTRQAAMAGVAEARARGSRGY